MSQENLELVVGMFEATNARDFKRVRDALADDVVLVLHGDVAGIAAGGAVGKPAFVQWFSDWFRTFHADYHFTIEETRDLGDHVFVTTTHHGRGKASGAVVTMVSHWLISVRDGRITRYEGYPDREQALAAAR